MEYTEKEYISKFYEVSRDGVVKRKTDGKIFKPAKDKKGYNIVRIKSPAYSKNKDQRKNYKIHRLVAMFYLEDYSDDLQVNHKNGVKTDNRVENLEMVSNRENVLHAWNVLDSTKRRESLIKRNSMNKENLKKMIQASIISNSKRVVKKNSSGDIIEIFDSATKASLVENVSVSYICFLIKNNRQRNGYYFYYE